MTTVVQLLISGDVQGVGFRYATQQTAINYTLRVQFKNKLNGRVEIIAQGSIA